MPDNFLGYARFAADPFLYTTLHRHVKRGCNTDCVTLVLTANPSTSTITTLTFATRRCVFCCFVCCHCCFAPGRYQWFFHTPDSNQGWTMWVWPLHTTTWGNPQLRTVFFSLSLPSGVLPAFQPHALITCAFCCSPHGIPCVPAAHRYSHDVQRELTEGCGRQPCPLPLLPTRALVYVCLPVFFTQTLLLSHLPLVTLFPSLPLPLSHTHAPNHTHTHTRVPSCSVSLPSVCRKPG